MPPAFDWTAWWPMYLAALLSAWLAGVSAYGRVLHSIEHGGKWQSGGCLAAPTWYKFPDGQVSTRVLITGGVCTVVGIGLAYWVPTYFEMFHEAPIASGVLRVTGLVVALQFGASRLAMFFLGALAYSIGLVFAARLLDEQLGDPSLMFGQPDAVRALVVVCLGWACYYLFRFVIVGTQVSGAGARTIYVSVSQAASAILVAIPLFMSLYEKIEGLRELFQWIASLLP